MTEYVLRREHFGGLLKDVATGTHRYLNEAEFAEWAARPGVRRAGLPAPPADRLSAPVSLAAVLTNRCGLGCKHCYMDAGERTVEELPAERWATLVRECGEMGVFEIRFTGGEPTLREDVFELARSARDEGITAALLSGGIWGPEMVERVLASAFDRFYISLEGLESTNDAIRGAGNYRRAVRSLRALAAAGRRTCLSIHLRESNITEVRDLVALAAELNVLIKFSPLRPVGRALRMRRDEFPGAVAMRTAASMVEVARREFPDTKVFIDFDLSSEGEALVPSHLFDNRGCHAARRMVGIDPAGRVYPCTFLWEWPGFVAGDLRRETLWETWLHSAVLQEFREAPRHPVCRSCEHYGRLCLGGCPALTRRAGGDISSMDPCCYAVAAAREHQESSG